ncbi:MAG: acyl-phosphate glycerol 3-phosphate acyltransferase [Clostridiales bacterium]|nr:MAG: acyl-phosphate glycerol 3-phosphate acyltransferase [Clostridiales bacterium]
MIICSAIAIGYVLGAIPFSFIVGKYYGKIDIRTVGSGNSGATNVFRSLGKKAAAMAFAGDFLKGVAAVLIGMALWGYDYGIIAGAGAILGHCYPVTLKFKGGKGVATSAGVLLALNPMLIVYLLPLYIVLVKVFKIVSLSSIIIAAATPILSYFMGMPDNFLRFALVASLFVIYRHKSNIQRLLAGEEKKTI